MPATLLEIGPDTGDLQIPALAPGQVWTSARLRIEAAPTFTFTPRLEAPDVPANGVPWVSATWTAMRPLTAIAITWVSRATPPNPPTNCHLTIKVATGGVWFTPVPPGRVHPRTYQPLFACVATQNPSFPPVMASALLLELRDQDPFKTDNGDPLATNGAIQRIEVTVQNPVHDLSVAIGSSAPVLQQKGRLGEPVEIDLLPALLAAPPGAALRLRATTTANVTVTWEPQALTRPAAPPAEPAIQRSTLGETLRWTQPLAAETVRAASGLVAWDGAVERFLRAPAGPPDLALAQAVFPGHDAAQALGALAEPATGVDLWISARTACCGKLRLVSEEVGRPHREPLAEAAWSLAAGESRWISVPMPARARDKLWLVCTADRGDAVIARAVLPDAPPPALQRRLGGAWDGLDEPLQRPHLHLRVRAPAPSRPPVPVHVRRGPATVTLASDGPFALDAAQLAELNKASGPVFVELTAPGPGTVTLAAWDVRLG